MCQIRDARWSVPPPTVEMVLHLENLRTADLHYSHNVIPNCECDKRRQFSVNWA